MLYKNLLFYPAMMIVVGAHYLPFSFLYGMRPFLGLGTVLIAAGTLIGVYAPSAGVWGGWLTGLVLVAFAFLGRAVALRTSDGRPAAAA